MVDMPQTASGRAKQLLEYDSNFDQGALEIDYGRLEEAEELHRAAWRRTVLGLREGVLGKLDESDNRKT